MPKIESKKIGCLYRPCSRPAPREKKNESVRTHSEVIEQFDSFRCSNSCFLLETDIAGHERLLLAKWHPKAEKNCENGGFSTPLTGMKSCTVDHSCTPAPKDATKLAVFLRFFRDFPWHFNKKKRAEVIFRFSRPVSRKIRKMAQGSDDLSTLPLIELFS